ncbi:MAG: ATP-binding protein [Bacilli bacterium]
MEIKRTDLLNKLIESMSSPLIKVIIGIRRCGKSYLLFKLFVDYLLSIGVKDNHIIKIKLDELSNSYLRNPVKLLEYIKGKIVDNGKYYVLLDEIQECVKIVNPAFIDDNNQLIKGISENEQWITYHDVLNELLNNNQVDCYVTGSNSRLLSSDLPTEFRNRNYNIEVYPLSFKEIKESFNYKEYDELWDEYITYGGMPLAVLEPNIQEKQKYLKDLFVGTYYKDIVERYNLNSDVSIDNITNIIASSIGSPINVRKIENTFKSNNISNICDNTIAKYLKYLENSFLIREANRYDVKGRKYIGTQSKYYFIDTGLRNARLNFRQVEESHLMENIIYIELLRQGYSVDVGLVEAFTKEKNSQTTKRINYEIDFIVNDGNKRIYIQSTLDLPNNDKLQQEQNSLLRIDDNFKKIIIVKGYKKPLYNEQGIIIVGLYNFLMNPKIIE